MKRRTTWIEHGMSKLIPLPNFYKKAEKLKREMVEKKSKKKVSDASSSDQPPKPDLIGEPKSRTFATVTNMGNTVTKKVREEENEEMKLDILKKGLADCIKQFVSIAFEKADVNDLITNDPNFQHLQFFNPMAVFSKDMDSLQAGQVMSMISNLQETVLKLTEKCSADTKANQDIFAKFEKVSCKLIAYLS